MSEPQDIDIFATAVYGIIKDYFDITLYRPTGEKVIFIANPRLHKRGWKRDMKTRLARIKASLVISRDGETYTIEVTRGLTGVGAPPLLNILLFILTFLTVLIASAFTQHGEAIVSDPTLLLSGLPFTLTLLFILMVHEMGHFWAGQARGVIMSYPYFIPAPTPLGTFGALIKGRTPIRNKNDLILIGAAGPLAGAVPAIIALAIGYLTSDIIPYPQSGMMYFGDSLLSIIIRFVTIGMLPQGMTVALSPIALAGKVGLLVTMLNLLPLGQLDGGHIMYGLFGKKQHRLAVVMLVALAGFGLLWAGWWLWLVLAIIMRPFHPPVIDNDLLPDKRHRIIGWISVILFILTFAPAPISFY